MDKFILNILYIYILKKNMSKLLDNQKQKDINLKEKQIFNEKNYLDMDDESKINNVTIKII
jgi:hypothetical protein